MNKFTLIFILLSLSHFGFSQSIDFRDLRAGGGFCYASRMENLGIVLNGAVEVMDEWGVATAFTYIFEADFVRWNVFDFDVHYNFYELGKSVNFYGLGGVSLTYWKETVPARTYSSAGFIAAERIEKGRYVGANLGVGMNIKVSDNLNIAPEFRFTIIEQSYYRAGATVQYLF